MLFRSHKPADPATLKRLLMGDALDLGPRGPDPGYGAGRVRLDVTPPHVVVQVEPGAPRATVRVSPGTRPVLRVTVTDNGTPGAIRILDGGRLLTTGRGPLLRFQAPVLANGVHKITVQANDLAGNGARTAVTLVVRPA